MPIDKARHPEFEDWVGDWRKCRVVLGGRESEVKAADFRETAIPKLDGHLDPKGAKFYGPYVARADWYPAASRTAEGLVGALTHKPPNLVSSPESLAASERVRAFTGDVTGTGVSWDEFLEAAEDDLLRVFRGGILVDFTAGDPPVGPAAAAIAAGSPRRPTWTWYAAESIEDWEYGSVDGRDELVYVKLCETRSVRGAEGDEYKREPETIYRELDLDEAGNYRQRLHRKRSATEGGKAGEYYVAEEIYPLVDDRPMRQIPFVIAPRRTASKDIQPPPLLPMVTKNLDHLQHSADHKNALRQAGSPQHILSGPGIAAKTRDTDGLPASSEDKRLVMGAGFIWTFPDAVNAQTLKIDGGAVSAIELALTRCETQLVVLGARIMQAERPAESGVAKEIDSRRDSSMLGRTAKAAGEALDAAFRFALPWLDAKSGVLTAEPNRDFFTGPITAEEVAMWLGLHDRRVVAMSDVRQALRDGERLALDRTDEDIDEELLLESPPGVGEPAADDAGGEEP